MTNVDRSFVFPGEDGKVHSGFLRRALLSNRKSFVNSTDNTATKTKKKGKSSSKSSTSKPAKKKIISAITLPRLDIAKRQSGAALYSKSSFLPTLKTFVENSPQWKNIPNASSLIALDALESEQGLQNLKKFFKMCFLKEELREWLNMVLDTHFQACSDHNWHSLHNIAESSDIVKADDVIVGGGPNGFRLAIAKLAFSETAPWIFEMGSRLGGQFGVSNQKAWRLNSRSGMGAMMDMLELLPGQGQNLNSLSDDALIDTNDIDFETIPFQTTVSIACKICMAFLTDTIPIFLDTKVEVLKASEKQNDQASINELKLTNSKHVQEVHLVNRRTTFVTGSGRAKPLTPAKRRISWNDFFHQTGSAELKDLIENADTIAIKGAGDNGSVIIEQLLGYYGSLDLTKRPRILWFGQEALTKETYEECARTRYKPFAVDFPREASPKAIARIKPIASKITSDKIRGNKVVIVDEKRKKHRADIIIDCSGLENSLTAKNDNPLAKVDQSQQNEQLEATQFFQQKLKPGRFRYRIRTSEGNLLFSGNIAIEKTIVDKIARMAVPMWERNRLYKSWLPPYEYDWKCSYTVPKLTVKDQKLILKRSTEEITIKEVKTEPKLFKLKPLLTALMELNSKTEFILEFDTGYKPCNSLPLTPIGRVIQAQVDGDIRQIGRTLPGTDIMIAGPAAELAPSDLQAANIPAIAIKQNTVALWFHRPLIETLGQYQAQLDQQAMRLDSTVLDLMQHSDHIKTSSTEISIQCSHDQACYENLNFELSPESLIKESMQVYCSALKLDLKAELDVRLKEDSIQLKLSSSSKEISEQRLTQLLQDWSKTKHAQAGFRDLKALMLANKKKRWQVSYQFE